jgi:hypothetical protein
MGPFHKSHQKQPDKLFSFIIPEISLFVKFGPCVWYHFENITQGHSADNDLLDRLQPAIPGGGTVAFTRGLLGKASVAPVVRLL